MISITELHKNNIKADMLTDFHHHQVIERKWVPKKGWESAGCPELREWSAEKRMWITQYLCGQIEHGGAVVAAYDVDTLVGFGSVAGCLLGKTARYANLTMLFVDDERKNQGIGKLLFERICDCAAKIKADKLFISAIPSYETVAFYFHVGCEDAKEIIPEFVDTKNDRYLEFSLI